MILLRITSDNWMTYLAIAIAALTAQYFFLRWVFSIEERRKHEQAQTKLLKEIALKLGVAEGEVNDIIETLNR